MSKFEATEPVCSRENDAIKILIDGKSRDLGGFSVRRLLPAPMARRVGPFVFFDEMGPADFPPGRGINVRPHPHIGLATVTFLLEGEILHRDSLGCVQAIRPGAVNLMTAGSGIVHSERTDPELERSGQRLHGLQIWMALPEDRQEIDPDFVHYPRQSLPIVRQPGLLTTVIIGEYNGEQSPVQVHAETLYLYQEVDAGTEFELSPGTDELAIYVVSGRISVDGNSLDRGVMAVVDPGGVSVGADSDARIMVIGGEDIGQRHIYWNFVHTSRDRIEQAKSDWLAGKFDPVPGDDEFIPLPGD